MDLKIVVFIYGIFLLKHEVIWELPESREIRVTYGLQTSGKNKAF